MKHVSNFEAAKVAKRFKIFFQKLLAKEKSVCIFAAGFAKGICDLLLTGIKVNYNEQENISAIKEKKKEQAWIHGSNGFCQWKESPCSQKSQRPPQADGIF